MASPGRYGPLPGAHGPPTPDGDRRRGPDPKAADWWLGSCPVCGTSVAIDDQFVRREGRILHLGCDRYELLRSLPRWARPLLPADGRRKPL